MSLGFGLVKGGGLRTGIFEVGVGVGVRVRVRIGVGLGCVLGAVACGGGFEEGFVVGRGGGCGGGGEVG